ncbi:aspartyl-phosphate phosphatase Spo0E family protein [Metabacillus rhizolycopersici]|uniref:Aspartyl-phosphate phosphatase Spo0E family protein n=1 Tax=Metabacillus rhizolycopersici TaxID=2875709 RepID=A0ABS7UNY9_9BACI|nr:aspartyl-phosphate phosphatase Spo0E family protein [Metabacillus rhizolycopersici]MBZ5750020.1 aspartyl-phosphate phosphatase Spo0E family protein [Metabacillus rhizolycopersici]
MDIFQLKKEIQSLRSYLYKLGNQTKNYSQGEILKISQELDKKILIYQKQMVRQSNKRKIQL